MALTLIEDQLGFGTAKAVIDVFMFGPICPKFGQLTPPLRQAYVCLKGGSAMNTNPTKKPAATVPNDPSELEIKIRERAYELYEARGREDGHDLQDWLRAEEEITEKKLRPIAA